MLSRQQQYLPIQPPLLQRTSCPLSHSQETAEPHVLPQHSSHALSHQL